VYPRPAYGLPACTTANGLKKEEPERARRPRLTNVRLRLGVEISLTSNMSLGRLLGGQQSAVEAKSANNSLYKAVRQARRRPAWPAISNSYGRRGSEQSDRRMTCTSTTRG